MTTATQVETLEVLGDKVAIRPLEAPEESEGGVYIPDMAREKPTRGTVISTGPDSKSGVVAGDVVVYPKYAGAEITVNGELVVVLREHELVGILRGP